jgi:hypothetical protein
MKCIFRKTPVRGGNVYFEQGKNRARVFDAPQRDSRAPLDSDGSILQSSDERFDCAPIPERTKRLGCIPPDAPIGVLEAGQQGINRTRITALPKLARGIMAGHPIGAAEIGQQLFDEKRWFGHEDTHQYLILLSREYSRPSLRLLLAERSIFAGEERLSDVMQPGFEFGF